MFYILAKLFWLVFEPANFLAWSALAAGVLLWRGELRWGRRAAMAAGLSALVFAILPTGTWLLSPIENRYYTPPALPHRVDGIVVLGGGQNARILIAHDMQSSSLADDRLLSAFALARQHPEARVVVSGAPGEAPEMATLLLRLGLSPDRLIIERRSRDTWENLRNSQSLVHPQAGQVWVLATSAYHLPRAMAISRRLGWAMLPYPTDYMTGPQWQIRRDFAANLQISEWALHEWVGSLAYRLSGRSAAKLQPAP